jgi:hypothetical protein
MMREGKAFSSKQFSIFTAIDPTRKQEEVKNFFRFFATFPTEEKAEKLSFRACQGRERKGKRGEGFSRFEGKMKVI